MLGKALTTVVVIQSGIVLAAMGIAVTADDRAEASVKHEMEAAMVRISEVCAESRTNRDLVSRVEERGKATNDRLDRIEASLNEVLTALRRRP